MQQQTFTSIIYMFVLWGISSKSKFSGLRGDHWSQELLMETGRILPLCLPSHLTVSDGISFFAGVWGSRLGDLPKVCGQNQAVPPKVCFFLVARFFWSSQAYYHTFGWYWKLRESPSPKTNMTGWKKSPCSIGKYIDSFRAWSHFPSQSRTFVLADPTPYCLALVALEVWMWHRATTNRMKVPKVWLTIRYHQARPWQRGLAGQGSNCVFCRFSKQERQRYIWGCGNTTKEMQRFFQNGGGV